MFLMYKKISPLARKKHSFIQQIGIQILLCAQQYHTLWKNRTVKKTNKNAFFNVHIVVEEERQ